MEQENFKYVIGGKAYIQRPLVLGQVNQLMAAIKGLRLPERFEPLSMIDALGGRLPKALAIVLIERTPGNVVGILSDENLRNRDLDARAADFEFSVDVELAARVIEDFFGCNPIASLLEKFAALGDRLMAERPAKPKGSSPRSSGSSPEETSPAATGSSGASPSPK